MVSSRQSKSVSKAADSRSLRRCLDLGDIRDQLRPKLARLLRSPREFCRNICGLKAGEDWKYGSPPLGSSSSPPPAGTPTSPVGALSPLVNGPAHTLWTHSPCVLWCCHHWPNPCLDPGVSIYNVPPLLSSCRISFQLSCLLINTAQFPPSKSTRAFTN